jgi:hypothetical protein
MDPAIPFLGAYTKELNRRVFEEAHACHIYGSTIHNTPKYPLAGCNGACL